jgi:hypothetical protein
VPGAEPGDEGADAELELVVGGDAGQQRGQRDGVGELARGQGGEEGVEAADELVAGLGVGAGPGDLQGDEAQDVGQQGVDGADHGLVGEPGRAQHAVDRLAQPQAVRAQAGLLDREGDHGGVGEQVGADIPADGGQLLGPVPGRVGVELEAGVDLVDQPLDQVVLATHVGVEGVRGDPEVVGQAAHGQGAGAVRVQQGEGRLDDQLAREEAPLPGPGRAAGRCHPVLRSAS